MGSHGLLIDCLDEDKRLHDVPVVCGIEILQEVGQGFHNPTVKPVEEPLNDVWTPLAGTITLSGRVCPQPGSKV